MCQDWAQNSGKSRVQLGRVPVSRKVDGVLQVAPKTAWLLWPGVNEVFDACCNGCCRYRNGNAERFATDNRHLDTSQVSFPAASVHIGRFNQAPVDMRSTGA